MLTTAWPPFNAGLEGLAVTKALQKFKNNWRAAIGRAKRIEEAQRQAERGNATVAGEVREICRTRTGGAKKSLIMRPGANKTLMDTFCRCR